MNSVVLMSVFLPYYWDTVIDTSH